MLNLITVQELAKLHQRELLKEAEARRMACQAKATQPDQPGPVERIVDGVGTLLIGIGGRLTERQATLG
jgi:hypothetical protein